MKLEEGGHKITTYDEQLTITLESLDFSLRTYNCLKRAGINSLFELIGKSVEELKEIKNMSRLSIREVEDKLAEYQLGDSPTEMIYVLTELTYATSYLTSVSKSLVQRTDIDPKLIQEVKDITFKLNDIHLKLKTQ